MRPDRLRCGGYKYYTIYFYGYISLSEVFLLCTQYHIYGRVLKYLFTKKLRKAGADIDITCVLNPLTLISELV